MNHPNYPAFTLLRLLPSSLRVKRLLLLSTIALIPPIALATSDANEPILEENNPLGIIYSIDQVPPIIPLQYDDIWARQYLAQYPLESVDRDSFNVIYPQMLAMDKNHLYFKDTIIEDGDPETIRFIGRDNGIANNIYLRDKTHLYINQHKMKNADPNTFEILEGGFTRDAHAIYFNGEAIAEADPLSYRPLRPDFDHYLSPNPGYGRDNHALYYDYQRLNLDNDDDTNNDNERQLDNFTVFENDDFATDGKALFYKGEVIPDIDATHLRFLKNRQIANDTHIYFYWMDEINEIEEADASTFEVINEHYSRDKNNLYNIDYDRYSIVNGVDPTTLHFFEGSRFFKDKDHVYLRLTSYHHGNRDESKLPKARQYDYQHLKIEQADAKSFTLVGGEYAKDNAHIYADLGNHYAIMTFDYDSFEYIGLGFVRDKTHLYGGIYYNFEIIEEADPNEATLIKADQYPIALQVGSRCFDQYDEIPCPIIPIDDLTPTATQKSERQSQKEKDNE